ncbi:MAG: hypothetical protein IKR19_08445 [Acholeplasmatales bacterium]|nr:hypothetical protein [Acholeplasmatales bacterium]
MFFKKKVTPQHHTPTHINMPEHMTFDNPKGYHPDFDPAEYKDDEYKPHKHHDDSFSSIVSLFSSPVVGSHAVFIDHSDINPEVNNFGIAIRVDDPAFQKACQDITIYDNDMNVIGTKDNISVIGFDFNEEYARPVVDAIDSMTSVIRNKYNQIYGLQHTIVEK